MTNIVVLISGRGSNMRAIVEACQSGAINANVAAVISNSPSAAGLEYAAAQGIPTEVLDHKQFNDRNQFDAQLQTLIDAYTPDWLVLAGFMRILTADFVAHYLGRMVNIHPSLLPLYTGLNTHARALEAGAKKHGATVHFVTADLDAGPIIAQSEVAVEADDTEQTLSMRVLGIEHELYTHALQRCVNGEVSFHE